MIEQGKDVPRNWVILTFDDGNENFYTQAYPIIKEFKFNVTLFMIVDNIGVENYLNWQQLKRLQKEGLTDFGSHSLSHRPLTLLSLAEAKREILTSRLILEKQLNKTVALFAYPFGAVDNATKEIIKESGYAAAVGTNYRRGEFKDQDIYVLRRIFVSNFSKHPFVFRFMLSGYYTPTVELVLRILNIRTPRYVWNIIKF